MTRPAPSLLLLAALALAACDGGDASPRDLPEPTAPPRVIEPPPLPPAAEIADAGPDDASDAGDAGDPLAALAGDWEGAYEAKKGRIDMPPGVSDPGRAADSGKTAVGAGAVKITITPAGDVTGRSQGALGPAAIRGKIDGKTLRSSFVPDDPLSPHAMTGVLVGLIKGDTIVAELRTAGPDALLVRQANFDLKKK